MSEFDMCPYYHILLCRKAFAEGSFSLIYISILMDYSFLSESFRVAFKLFSLYLVNLWE